MHGKLIIPERGVLGANSITAIYGCDIILPDYYGPVPDGERFAGWDVYCDDEWNVMQPGEHVVSDGDITILRVFDQMGMPGSGGSASTIPETGDSANIALWCGLAAISIIGMAMMLRKMKEA